ncbi:hypothetical protein JTB14_010281 [Gonioctena quinquepunctata]|nr:hypothetical protein JTB14_010281 [Gonioctena quinquepunctata]
MEEVMSDEDARYDESDVEESDHEEVELEVSQSKRDVSDVEGIDVLESNSISFAEKDEKKKFAHINIRSRFTGSNDLRNLVITKEYDLLAVSGTWLETNSDVTMFQILRYKFIHSAGDTRGGGVEVFFRKSYRLKILISVIYRPPNSNIREFLNKFEESLTLVAL